MALHEMMKNVKIIDEVLIYLVEKGYTKVHIDFDLQDDDTLMSIIIDNPSLELIRCLKQDIHPGRDLQLEEYGWELMGENDYSCELSQVGMLIDDVQIVEKDGTMKLLLIRHR